MSLGKDRIDWLLASSTPSIRLATMTKMLGREASHPQVLAERREIMGRGPVPAILEGQSARGNWQPERSYYTPKYTSTHWSMLLLAELEVDGGDARARRGGAEYMLAATEAEVQQGVAHKAHGMSCFWGNVLHYALHCGCAGDPRLSVIIEYLARDALDWQWQCEHNWEHQCAWGARSLWGLALLPMSLRSKDTEAAIEAGLNFLLAGERLVQGDFPTGGSVHSIWSRLNFPLFYQADILFVLRLAAEMKALEREGARAALDWLASRRLRTGRWRGASPFRQRTWQALSDAQDIDRWVSLHAAHILRSAAG